MLSDVDREARSDWLDERERWAEDHWDYVEQVGALEDEEAEDDGDE